MSDQQHRPVPGPRPGPLPGPVARPAAVPSASAAVPTAPAAPVPGGSVPPDRDGRFAGLAARPVTEHVGVFEAELERLQRELSTIDQL